MEEGERGAREEEAWGPAAPPPGAPGIAASAGLRRGPRRPCARRVLRRSRPCGGRGTFCPRARARPSSAAWRDGGPGGCFRGPPPPVDAAPGVMLASAASSVVWGPGRS